MSNDISNLSFVTKKLWGKLARDGSDNWLPLYIHLRDAGEVAKLIWDHWLPKPTKQIIAGGIDFAQNIAEDKIEYAKKVVIFLAAAHDIGKAMPNFQMKAKTAGFSDIITNLRDSGLLFPMQSDDKSISHAVVSEIILENHGLDRSYAVTVGSHHGRPPESEIKINHIITLKEQTGIEDEKWEKIHSELLNMVLNESGLDDLPKGKILLPAQMLVTSIIVVSDWIASGNGFHLFSLSYNNKTGDSLKRALEAWQQLNLPAYKNIDDIQNYKNLYQQRFGIMQPRPMQDSALQVAENMEKPELLVIEAPMGEGKTEAALAAAEVFMDKFGLSGIYFALPTQATSDGIFKRIKNWIEKLPRNGENTIFLAHGKAGFNEDYAGIKLKPNIDRDGEDDEDKIPERVTINDWTQGRRKGLLSDFVVGTIDQVLMCGLKQKYLALRHLGVVNKVVVIDECHAYDVNMCCKKRITA